MRNDDKNLVLSKRMEKCGVQQVISVLNWMLLFVVSHQTTKFGICECGHVSQVFQIVSCDKSDNRPHFCMPPLNSVLKYSY